jgi:hypothetical protein
MRNEGLGVELRGSPPDRLCIVWHPAQSPTPPAWNASAGLPRKRVTEAAAAKNAILKVSDKFSIASPGKSSLAR